MNPEAAEAIRIANKHLPGGSALQRLALANDIQESIILFAGLVACEAVKEAFAKAGDQQRENNRK